MLLAVSITMTGCDASKILDTISKVASAVQTAIPKVKEVVDTISSALPNNTNTADNTTIRLQLTILPNRQTPITPM